MNKKVRIGIDVGGTFTDAVLICNQTGEILAKEKTPTTHYSENGVAEGIVTIVDKVMKSNDINPDDVVFIAHGTTQATNALLEGDVASVGVIGIASSMMAKKELTIDNIELAPGRNLNIITKVIKPSEATEEKVSALIDELISEGAEVIVASEEYSVDNSTLEKNIVELCTEKGILATSGHQISELYGLRVRTKTAVVNASLIPKMLETALMTEEVVKKLGIKSELMIMRADGGVMSVQEIKERPILTMLSGLAAGVAGALMHEKVTDGIFMEVGGTSIDISVIKDGKVMVNNASVGNHKMYLKALDVRTLAIAGGSMIRISDDKIVDVGPRSAHLADLEYEAFNSLDGELSIDTIQPLDKDPADYAVINTATGRYALTLCGAANLLGYVDASDYAYGKQEEIKKAWTTLGAKIGMSAEEAARQAMDIATDKIWKIISSMIKEYELDTRFLTLVGGGGSAAVTTAALGEKYQVSHKIANNAPYISTIGVALAMVREQLERSIIDPSTEDIKQIRIDITNKVISSGAKKETIQVDITIDSQKNILRAVATGASEFNENASINKLSEKELKAMLATGYNCQSEEIVELAKNGSFNVFDVPTTVEKVFGLVKSKVKYLCVVNNEGVILNRLKGGKIKVTSKGQYSTALAELIEDMSTYSDAGKTIPKLYLFANHQHYDYSGLINEEQVYTMIQMDMENIKEDEILMFTAEGK